jgi:hypothetical protein
MTVLIGKNKVETVERCTYPLDVGYTIILYAFCRAAGHCFTMDIAQMNNQTVAGFSSADEIEPRLDLLEFSSVEKV